MIERERADAGEQGEQRAHRARDPEALQAPRRRGERDRDDHRHEDRQQQRHELAEQQAEQQQGRREQHRPVDDLRSRRVALAVHRRGLRYAAEETDGRLEGARPNIRYRLTARLGAALEVGHILGLLVGPVLGLGELLLLLALALLATALGPQRPVAA